jgi:hypothetical protein
MPKAVATARLGAALFFVFALAAAGPGCTAGSAGSSVPEGLGDPPAGAIRGELSYNVATYDDGRTETE